MKGVLVLGVVCAVVVMGVLAMLTYRALWSNLSKQQRSEISYLLLWATVVLVCVAGALALFWVVTQN